MRESMENLHAGRAFRMKTFELEGRGEFDPAMLRWPNRGEIHGEDAAPAGNQYYRDLTKFSWSQAGATLRLETALVDRVCSATDPAAEEQVVMDELEALDDMSDAPSLWGLDLGVAAAVLTLSAAGAVPVASCNGGAFGSQHVGRNPYVAFFVRPRRLWTILEWCEQANLVPTVTDGIAVLHAKHIRDFHLFAAAGIAQNIEK